MPKCIFCWRTNLSEEHILSDWLKNIIPKDAIHKEAFQGVIEKDGKLQYVEIAPEIVDGAVHGKTAKCVCVDCNTTWMHNIVDASLPWVRRAVLGEHWVFNKIQQRQMASWIGLSAVIASWKSKSRHKISQVDLDYFVAKGTPPPHWSIFIGYYYGDETTAINNNALAFVKRDNPDKSVFCLHNVAAIVKRLYTVTHGIYPPIQFSPPDGVYYPHLTQLWPPLHDEIGWPAPIEIIVRGNFDPGGGLARDLAIRLPVRLRQKLRELGFEESSS